MGRLPIVITAPNIKKLLGVHPLPSGTEKEICSAVHNALQEWYLVDKFKILYLIPFASNSGRLNRACVLLKQLLNGNILFFTCCHHIFKIILQAIFLYTKLTVMSDPDIPLFKRFKSN